ncbi:MAG: transposase [Myxococcales bacterium]|nr:MAG: transposase [Myxococcales bacterium]
MLLSKIALPIEIFLTVNRGKNTGFERVLTSFEKKCLRARGLIETVNDQLKNIFQIEHTRHRSIRAFFVSVLAGLAAYTFRPAKPKMA